MSGFIIKLIAIIGMTIDHAFKICPGLIAKIPDFPLEIPGVITFSFLGLVSLLGRISFPLFAFGVAEGCIHTKNFVKYLRRLFIFAIISELPFDFMFHGGFTMSAQNVMWTFFFGVFAIFLYEKLKPSMVLGLLSVAAITVVCYMCNTDYKSIGVILIFAMYIIRNKPAKLIAVFAVICSYYLYQRGLGSAIKHQNINLIVKQSLYLGATLLSIPIMATYNGKKGPGMKWFFYIYYPLHLVLLGMVEKLWI